MVIDLEKFHEEGYLGPFTLFNGTAPSTLLQEMYAPQSRLSWYKSPHEKSAPIVETASAPAILDLLQPILGKDILLWGSIFIGQKPEKVHDWHLDVEHGKWDGVTLWLGLKNLSNQTTVSLITRSHLLSNAPQELQKKLGIDASSNDAILSEARKLDPKCELRTFALKDGEFIIWSGRVWHATLNKSAKTRYSLILQYCTPDSDVSIPLSYDYPDTKWSEAKPTCILVAGNDHFGRNKVLRREEIETSNQAFRKLYLSICRARSILAAVKKKAETLCRPAG